MVPDYYAMLGVEPSADRAAIEAALERCRHQWSSGTRNPKYKHTYQSYLDQVPEIRRRLMGEPTARVAYDSELAAEAVEVHERKLDQLQRLVRLRAAKGGLTVTDRSLLRDRAGQLGLSADDLARLIEPIPPRPEPPAEADDMPPAGEVLDPVTRRQIRAALDLVARRDLYDALGLPRDAPAAEVAARADGERQKWMRKSQVTAEKTAWLEVVSYAQSHLGKPDGRARYDRSLAADAEEVFETSLAFTLDGLPALDPGTRLVLLDEGARLGVPADRAERLILRACRSRGVSRDGGLVPSAPGGAGPARYLRCRSCGGVVEFGRVAKDPDRATCRHCRSSLRWECPVCHRGHWADEPRCPCGFEVRNLEPLLRHFEAAQHAFRARDDEAAIEHLARVQEFAPHHVGARKAVEKVKARHAEVEARRADFELARGRRRLVEAREALLAWSQLVDPASPHLLAAQAELISALKEAQGIVSRARGVESTDPKAARDLFRQALAVAADLPEALEGLRRSPPDPPGNLRVEPEGEAVVLRWTPPPPDGLSPPSFRVVRKADEVPASVSDGRVLCEVLGTTFLDTTAVAGRSTGYAVFSWRDGVASAGAATVAPFFFLLDIRELRAEGDRGEIRLGWTLPPGAVGAKVVRLGGAGAADRPVEALADHAVDRDLDEKRVYRYRVAAAFRGPDGRTAYAPGVEIAASATPPAEPAGPLSIRALPDGRVEVRWPPVPRGKVVVLKTAEPLPYPPGSRLGEAEADRFEGTRLLAGRGDSAVDPEPPTLGACHYVAIVCLNGTATIGASFAYSCVPDPTDLRAVRFGAAGRVHLRWRWTPRATETVVAARRGGPPSRPDEPGAVFATVNEADYSRLGYYGLNLPNEVNGGGPWHLAVFSLATVDGVRLTSPGLEPSARTVVPGPNPEVTVSYTLRRPAFLGRPWAISLQTDPPGSPIPPLALVARKRTVPLSPDDGEVVERFPACNDGATFQLRPTLDLARHNARLFPDPDAEPAGLAPIRLKHPESSPTRV